MLFSVVWIEVRSEMFAMGSNVTGQLWNPSRLKTSTGLHTTSGFRGSAFEGHPNQWAGEDSLEEASSMGRSEKISELRGERDEIVSQAKGKRINKMTRGKENIAFAKDRKKSSMGMAGSRVWNGSS